MAGLKLHPVRRWSEGVTWREIRRLKRNIDRQLFGCLTVNCPHQCSRRMLSRFWRFDYEALKSQRSTSAKPAQVHDPLIMNGWVAETMPGPPANSPSSCNSTRATKKVTSEPKMFAHSRMCRSWTSPARAKGALSA